MAENVYLLKVGSSAGSGIKDRLGAEPSHVRVSTLAPLSNYGYPAGAEGTVLSVSDSGLTIGVEGNDAVPRAWVPWQNVSYVADGQKLADKRS